MLRATAAVLRRHRSGDPADAPYAASSYATTIGRRGSHVDAALILPLVLESPQRYASYLPVLERHGDGAMAEQLMDRCVRDGRLAEGIDTRVLRSIGYLGVEAAEPMLFDVASDAAHGPNIDACLGLLALPCRVGQRLQGLKLAAQGSAMLCSIELRQCRLRAALR